MEPVMESVERVLSAEFVRELERLGLLGPASSASFRYTRLSLTFFRGVFTEAPLTVTFAIGCVFSLLTEAQNDLSSLGLLAVDSGDFLGGLFLSSKDSLFPKEACGGGLCLPKRRATLSLRVGCS